MMKTILYIVSFLLATTVFAQYTITLDAYILDEDTKLPIPFVNIQCVGKDIKTITDASGKFTLSFEEAAVQDTDTFQFISHGYDTVTVKISTLARYLTMTNKIYLTSREKVMNANTFSGTVFSEQTGKIQNASVRVKNTFTETQTLGNGKFNIPAKIGDTLVVDFIGMSPKEIVISNRDAIVIELFPNEELLKEVLIQGKKAIKEKRYIDTGFGKADFNSFSFGSVLTSEDIGTSRVYLTDVLRGRIAGLRVTMGEGNVQGRFGGKAVSNNKTQPGQPVLTIRGTEAIVYYDGFPYYGNIDEINVNTVDTIVILKSLSATILYEGKPTIIITSKSRFLEKDENGNVINKALATNNNYKETVPLLSNTIQKQDYLLALQKATSYKEALEILNVQLQNKKFQTVSYYIDVSEYFMKWNAEKALSILMMIEKIAGNNTKALKALAYKLEEFEQFSQAKIIYQRIATLLPNAAQSYRDLAMIYKLTGDYQQSMDLYKNMLANTIENVDFSGLEKPLLSELQHLVTKHRLEVDYKELPNNLLLASFKYDMRIVFEWNDPTTEFEIQFVNPKNKFYIWKHSIIDNKARMLDEVKNGYHIEEFIIDSAIHKGEWTVNVKSLTEETEENPTYLKYVTYKNYGLPNEERIIKVVKLYNQQKKATLDKIVYQ